MSTRFKLEEHIMQCWRTGDDIQLLGDHADSLTQDELLNAIIGIAGLHEMRMKQLFRTFETMIAEMKPAE